MQGINQIAKAWRRNVGDVYSKVGKSGMKSKLFIREKQFLGHISIRMYLYRTQFCDPEHGEGRAFMLIRLFNLMKRLHAPQV